MLIKRDDNKPLNVCRWPCSNLFLHCWFTETTWYLSKIFYVRNMDNQKTMKKATTAFIRHPVQHSRWVKPRWKKYSASVGNMPPRTSVDLKFVPAVQLLFLACSTVFLTSKGIPRWYFPGNSCPPSENISWLQMTSEWRDGDPSRPVDGAVTVITMGP